MKLHLSLLERLITLPSTDTYAVAELLDDVGLEVKGIDTTRGYPIVYDRDARQSW
jgi:hypothetical protein